MKSIKSRLTLVSMIVLACFMVLTALVLEQAVVKRALQAEEDRLQVIIYSLLAAVDRSEQGSGITVSHERLFESSLGTRDSGLYAMMYNKNRDEIWRSQSTSLTFPDFGYLGTGNWQFRTLEFRDKPYLRLAFAIQWPNALDQLESYDVVVWQEAGNYYNQLERFRQTLWAWLIVTTVLLLAVMYIVLVWSLRPLKKVGLEIIAIEDRKQNGFLHNYPSEIKPLTENLNILLNREQYQLQRYRNAMDDLAHSLKTPLAVLNGLTDIAPDGMALNTLREQVDRMNQIVTYQLHRASRVAAAKINKPVDLVMITGKIISALEKVYREKKLNVECRLPEHMMLRMDESDCLEVLGNLFDNAFKYGHRMVLVKAHKGDDDSMVFNVEDDGNGLAQDEIEHLLNRGTRLDQTSEGQGIGLAVVADIVRSYNIELSFAESSLGGLNVRLVFQTA